MSEKDLNRINEYNRRSFLKQSLATGIGASLGGMALSGCSGLLPRSGQAPLIDMTAKPIDTVRVGFVGLGNRGRTLMNVLVNLDHVEVKAVCDIKQDRVEAMQNTVVEAGYAKPVGYCCGETDYEKLCDRDDLDLVINATPWQWHTPISVAAMKAGKHTATEVPAALTVDECWQLVETSEKTGKHCVMLENCCYWQHIMMILNMTRQGMFGDLVHCEAGYQHDRIDSHFKDDKYIWRTKHYAKRDNNPYPTHPIGPIAQWMNINRGDQFDYLNSMSSDSKSIQHYAREALGKDHPWANIKFKLGDINTSMIRTMNGLTITLYHDTQLPRPYDPIFRVQGINGIYMGNLDKMYLRGKSPEAHTWESTDGYAKEFKHPLWKKLGEKAENFGHGGADFMELYRLINALRTGTAPDMDVYDAASWSVITDLTERSVARKGRPEKFPDFTRGSWKNRQPVKIMGV